MGFGFPAAMGAQAAFPGRLVLCIAGDGSIQMNMQEMATAVVHKLPVKIIVLNNRFHGMVRQWQDLFYEGRYASSYLETTPDFVKLAEAYGAVGLRANKPSETILGELTLVGRYVNVMYPNEAQHCRAGKVVDSP